MQARTHKLRIGFYFHHWGCFGDQFSDPWQAASAGIQMLAGWQPAGVTVLQSKLCHSPVCGGNILNLCLCHPITELTCRTCAVRSGTQRVLIYSGSTETWIFILRIRRKSAFPAVLWRALLADSPFLGLFLLVQSLCGCPLSPSPRWRHRRWTRSFCSKPWCLLALSECSSLHSWRALMCWVEVRCLAHGSGMKQELSSKREWERERGKHGQRVRKSVWWGQMDPQLGCCFYVLVEVEGRYSTARNV